MYIKGEDIKEDFANLAHDQWSGWMKYLFEKSHSNEDLTVTIPAHLVARWTRQMHTDYGDLSYQEQESDRKEAEKFIQIIKFHNIG